MPATAALIQVADEERDHTGNYGLVEGHIGGDHEPDHPE